MRMRVSFIRHRRGARANNNVMSTRRARGTRYVRPYGVRYGTAYGYPDRYIIMTKTSYSRD